MISPLRVCVDGYPVDMDNLDASSRANLGYDQLRAISSHDAFSRLPWTAGLGSVVTVYDDTDQVAWEGRLSASPTIAPDETVRLAAQGHAYQSAKSVRRLPIKVTSPLGWVVANTSPLDFPQTASAQPTIAYSASGALAVNRFTFSYTSATDVSVAYFAPGARIRRFTFGGLTPSGTPTIKVWGAVGPGINVTKVLLTTLSAAEIQAGGTTVSIPANDFDCIIINLIYSGATSGSLTVTNPIVWGTETFDTLKSHRIAAAIGELFGWDTSTIEAAGTVIWPSFDWGADAAGGLSEASLPDDFRWRVLDDRGSGPVLEFGPWERTWEVSASEGATWTLDPLEPYTKVVVQYLDTLGKARAVTSVLDPDPYLGRITNELRAVAGGLESVDSPSGLPQAMADNLLEWATSARWRGSISASVVREAGTGLVAPNQVRGGDLVRITDFSPTDGSVTLRVSEVQLGPYGITMGIEAPAIPGGSLAQSSSGITPGTFNQIDDPDAPSGSPGSTTPVGSVLPPQTGGGIGPGGYGGGYKGGGDPW